MLNKIDDLSNLIVDYYSYYQDDYIGGTYKNKEEAIGDIKGFLKEFPRNQMQEMLDEVNHLFLNENLHRNSNDRQLRMALTILIRINEVMYDKSKELEA